MQSIFACSGVIICALFYGALFRLAVATFEKTEQWHRTGGLCRTWPESEDEVLLLDIEQHETSCVFPDIARSRSASHSDSFLAKEILHRAYDSCVKEGVCSL